LKKSEIIQNFFDFDFDVDKLIYYLFDNKSLSIESLESKDVSKEYLGEFVQNMNLLKNINFNSDQDKIIQSFNKHNLQKKIEEEIKNKKKVKKIRKILI